MVGIWLKFDLLCNGMIDLSTNLRISYSQVLRIPGCVMPVTPDDNTRQHTRYLRQLRQNVQTESSSELSILIYFQWYYVRPSENKRITTPENKCWNCKVYYKLWSYEEYILISSVVVVVSHKIARYRLIIIISILQIETPAVVSEDRPGTVGIGIGVWRGAKWETCYCVSAGRYSSSEVTPFSICIERCSRRTNRRECLGTNALHKMGTPQSRVRMGVNHKPGLSLAEGYK